MQFSTMAEEDVDNVIRFVLASDTISDQTSRACGYLTSIMVRRNPLSRRIRDHGPALMEKFRLFLLRTDKPLHKNDYFHAILWMFDPDLGDQDPILPALLRTVDIFVAELERALANSTFTAFAGNIVNGLANLIAYVGRHVCKEHFERAGVMRIVAQSLAQGSPNTVSSALLIANFAGESPEYAPVLQEFAHEIVGVLRAALEDDEFKGRAWSPKGACQALSCMSGYRPHHATLVALDSHEFLVRVILRDWFSRDNYQSLGARYFFDAQGYAARVLWNLRSEINILRYAPQLAVRLRSLIAHPAVSPGVTFAFNLLLKHVLATTPIAPPTYLPRLVPAAEAAPRLVLGHPGAKLRSGERADDGSGDLLALASSCSSAVVVVTSKPVGWRAQALAELLLALGRPVSFVQHDSAKLDAWMVHMVALQVPHID
eukprot:m.33048 g.33048  ORF g.33048 m.33048 type:complete len:430 (-) comp5063_c0_seq1:97-1386(-)